MRTLWNRSIGKVIMSCFSIVGFFGATSVSAEPVMKPFEDGSKVVFLGDSITHNGFYHSYIYHFYHTRFPERDVKFYNAGVSSGKSVDALTRLEWDVLSHQPTDIIINLGMNDVGTSHFVDRELPDDERNKDNEKFSTRYKTNMIELLDRIEAAGDIDVTLIIPTPYDAYVDVEREPAIGKNEAVRALGEFLIQQANERGMAIVDFNTLIRDINLREQLNDPTFTLVSPDRVHPRKPGHMISAYSFFKAQGLERTISETIIDVNNQEAKAINATVENLSVSPTEVTFTLTENSLPYFIDSRPESSDRPSAEPALDFIPFHKEFNRQLLTVQGLSDGEYLLKINDSLIGKYSSTELASGIDTNSSITKTPQYQQSEKLQELNEKRWKKEREYRSIVWGRAMVLDPACVSIEDHELALSTIKEYMLDDDITDSKLKYLQSWLDSPTAEDLNAIQKSVDDLTQQIREAGKPQPHQYTLTKVR